jgi:hypothetical protein
MEPLERSEKLDMAIARHVAGGWQLLVRVADHTAVVEHPGRTPPVRRTLHVDGDGEVLYQDPGTEMRPVAAGLVQPGVGTPSKTRRWSAPVALAIIGLFALFAIAGLSVPPGPDRAALERARRLDAEDKAARSAAAIDGGAPAKAAVVPVGEAPLRLESFRCFSSSDRYNRTEGQVTNMSGHPIDNITAQVTWYTAAGEFVAADDALIDLQPLQGGERSNFSIMTRAQRGMEKCQVSFRRLGGGSLAHVTK